MGSTGAAQTACAAPSSAAARPSRGAAALQPCRAAAPLVPLSGVRYAPPEPLQTHVEHPRTGGYGGAARRAREGSCGVHWRRERAQPTPPAATPPRRARSSRVSRVTLHARDTPPPAPHALARSGVVRTPGAPPSRLRTGAAPGATSLSARATHASLRPSQLLTGFRITSSHRAHNVPPFRRLRRHGSLPLTGYVDSPCCASFSRSSDSLKASSRLSHLPTRFRISSSPSSQFCAAFGGILRLAYADRQTEHSGATVEDLWTWRPRLSATARGSRWERPVRD